MGLEARLLPRARRICAQGRRELRGEVEPGEREKGVLCEETNFFYAGELWGAWKREKQRKVTTTKIERNPTELQDAWKAENRKAL